MLQPIKKTHGHRFHLAPYSVMVDPTRALEFLSSPIRSCFPENVLYIFRKQLEKADVIVVNKADVAASADLAARAYPPTRLRGLSELRRAVSWDFPTNRRWYAGYPGFAEPQVRADRGLLPQEFARTLPTAAIPGG